MTYNVTNLTNATGFGDIAVELNNLVFQNIGVSLFAIFLLFSTFVITMAILKNHDGYIQFLSGSVMSTFVCVIIWAMGMVSLYYVIVCITILIISLVLTIWGKG